MTYDPFLLLVKAHNLPTPVTEHRFDAKRKWRLDYAWPRALIAIEREGGVWTQGRHTRGKGFLGDMEKYNAAQLAGWIVLRFTPEQLEKGAAIPFVAEALRLYGCGDPL